MAGIESYGAYIPIYRLKRDQIMQVWENPLGSGEKAVANWDEDSLTMGVEAAIDCTKWSGLDEIDGLYFTTVTPAYREKESASIIAAVLGLRKDIFTADFTDSLRGATKAIRAAVDAVKAGTARKVLVIAADCRQAPPDSIFEGTLGDGAAAFLISNSEGAVNIESMYYNSSDFIDIWKRDEDTYMRTWEERFVYEGYLLEVKESTTAAMKKSGLEPKDFNHVVLYGHDARRQKQMAMTLGFDMKGQVQDPLFHSIGNTGNAFAPMMLVAALEKAKAGEKILMINYGDGCDVFTLEVTEAIENLRDRRGIKRHLESKLMLPSYGRYLKFRNMMEWEMTGERDMSVYSSLPLLWRDRKQVLQFMGRKCRKCGQLQIDFPIQRICNNCQAEDDFYEVRLADKKGMLFTFAWDERTMDSDPPGVIGVVDFQDGARFRGKITDRDATKLRIGAPMEMTFRKIHDGKGIRNYFWKIRPIRCEE